MARAGRDPATLRRALDLYTVDPLNRLKALPSMLAGTAEEIGGTLLGFAALGFDEIRCNVHP